MRALTLIVLLFPSITKAQHMVKIYDPAPPGYLYYTLNGRVVPPETYIPLDYNRVGGLKAIDKQWKIAKIVRPKQIIGLFYKIGFDQKYRIH